MKNILYLFIALFTLQSCSDKNESEFNDIDTSLSDITATNPNSNGFYNVDNEITFYFSVKKSNTKELTYNLEVKKEETTATTTIGNIRRDLIESNETFKFTPTTSGVYTIIVTLQDGGDTIQKTHSFAVS